MSQLSTRRGVRIRVPKGSRRSRGVRIRVAAPTAGSGGLASALTGMRVAISIAPGELRLFVTRGNSTNGSPRQLRAALPERSVRPGLSSPNLADVEWITTALRDLAREAGIGKKRPGLVSLLIPDQAVRLALVPLEGEMPGYAEGEAMARWALRDLLPTGGDEARIDWTIVSSSDDLDPQRWIFAMGAAAEVIREYEAVVEELGFAVGRAIPMTMALAVGSDDAGTHDPEEARLVLTESGGWLACVVEVDGVLQLHRAWRHHTADLPAELLAVDRYSQRRLGLTITDAIIAGSDDWRGVAAAACGARGWTVTAVSRWSAHRGAVQ